MGHDYTNQFHGLSVSAIPQGKYKTSIVCNDGELSREITVGAADNLEIMAFSGRILRSDHVRTQLAIKLANMRPGNELWWVRLTGAYNGQDYVDRFDAAKGEARIVDPEPGVYLATVRSTSGYGCFAEVQFVEFTRSWVFDPSSCSFQVDRFAHLIQRNELHKPKPDRWAEDMRREKGEFLRELNRAADKQ